MTQTFLIANATPYNDNCFNIISGGGIRYIILCNVDYDNDSMVICIYMYITTGSIPMIIIGYIIRTTCTCTIYSNI